MTLKAELRRSIEVVLAGNHFVAELSTGFEKSLIYLYQLLPFAFVDHSGGILLLLKKKKTERGPSSSGKRQICEGSGINLWHALCLLHPGDWSERRSFHSPKGIYVRKAGVMIQQMTDRRGVFFSLHVTPPLWSCGAPSLGWGNFPS